MVDKPNYKKHLTPEQYEICWNMGLNLRFQVSITTAKIRASTSVSAAATAYSPPTPNSILALAGPASGRQ